jgi:hypothetical protein
MLQEMLPLCQVAPRSAGVCRWAMVAGVCLALSSCSDGGPSEPGDPAPGAARLLLGTGEQHYVPIEDEPVLPLVAGIQGGFHVWATFLGYGYQGDRLDMQITSTWGPNGEYVFPSNLATIRVHEIVDDNGEVALEGSGWPARVELARCSQGQRIVLEMTVSDELGATASDRRAFVSEVQEAMRGTDCPSF